MITIVSGLPRSGTSLMMQMLEAGGMPVLTDGARPADNDNCRGYYELEKVKRLERDKSWLPQAENKAVKVVSALLYELPASHRYRVLFMLRDLDEVLRSQTRMLQRLDAPDRGPPASAMRGHFQQHLERLRRWLAGAEHMDVLYCEHRALFDNPEPLVEQIVQFLDRPLDKPRMLQRIDPSLWRHRSLT